MPSFRCGKVTVVVPVRPIVGLQWYRLTREYRWRHRFTPQERVLIRVGLGRRKRRIKGDRIERKQGGMDHSWSLRVDGA